MISVTLISFLRTKALSESRSIGELAKCLTLIKKPLENGRIKTIPRSAAYFISFIVRASQKLKGGKPSLPGTLGKIFEVLATFDSDFSQSFVDGRIYEGLDHADALRRVDCPMVLIHANWHRHPDYGLVSAMDDDDAARAQEIGRETQFKRNNSVHVIHTHNPEVYAEAVRGFVTSIS